MDITKEELEEFIKAHATKNEIINYYEGEEEALNLFCTTTYGLDFKTTYNKLLAESNILIKKQLLDIATNPKQTISKHQLTMLIYLSKVYCKLNEETRTGYNQTKETSDNDFIKDKEDPFNFGY